MPIQYQRAPRMAQPKVPSGVIALQVPPELAPSDGISSLLSSMLPMLGSIGSVIMVTLTNAGPAGLLTGGMFMMSSLGFVGVNGWRQRSQHAAGVLAARREYLAYLAELRESVRNAASAQRKAGEWSNPKPSALVYLAEERTRVWERSGDDADFLHIRMGVADQPLCMTLEAPEIPALASLDPVATSAVHRFMLAHEVQSDLPFSINLADYARIELTGRESGARSLARSIIAQAATMHSPDLLQIVVLASDRNLPAWDWAKWLPHAQSPRVRDAVGPARMIAPVLSEIEDMLPEDLPERPRFGRGGARQTPHVLVVLDGGHVSPGNSVVTEDGIAGVTVLELPDRWDDLDDPRRVRFQVGDANGVEIPEDLDAEEIRVFATLKEYGQSDALVSVDQLSIIEAEAVARRLAPLYSSDASQGGPQQEISAELVDLLGVGDVRDIDYDAVWQPRLQRDRLRVPIGLTTEGQPIYLDIKESAQQGMGPHGLIIGATGSGKSEVLRTLVLALALTHSPEQLNFVLVDFKGGATFAGMADMPHVSAVITNLGEELSLVDRMQDALQGEMVRRQELLRSAGNFANVSDYEKARTSGGRTDLEPLPALLIVADEFSELLTAKPEFADTFVAIGRLGRSLQVHLLMSSQRLEEGKLRGLDSHLSYRIGLRTFSAAESRTVLGVPDAYTLPPVPGMGYLKPDTTTMIQFRAAYVSGPPKGRRAASSVRSGAGGEMIEPFTAAPVIRVKEAVVEVESDEPDEKRATFDIAVERMRGRGPRAHQVWLPPLVTPPSFDQLMPDLAVDPELGLVSKAWRQAGELVFPLGIVDRPLEQRRENLVMSLAGAAGHLAIVGAPRSGKSTGARSVLTALALTRTPKEVQFYVIDLGGGTFTPMQKLAHVAGVATRNEPDVMRRMLAELTSIINDREIYFRAHSIDSIETYRQRRAKGQADDGYGDVFLIIDGWGAIRSDFEELEPQVVDLVSRGLTFGVHVVLTAARWTEIRANIKDLVGSRIEFRLGDPADSDVDRKAARNVPLGAPGRGLSASHHHMMGALPRVDDSGDSTTLSDGVEDLIAKVNGAWLGPVGPKLRLLPEEITLSEIQSIAPADQRRLWLGVDEANLAPWGLDPAANSHLYLYGDIGSGKSSMLRAFAQEISRMYTPDEAKIFAIDYRRALLGEIPSDYLGAYLTTHEMASGGMQELAEFFRSRLPGPDVTPDQLRDRTWWSGAEGFVLIDDYDLVATSQGNPVSALVPLLAQAGDVGLHVVLTRRSGGAARASYDSVIQALTDLGTTGILLSGDPNEGALIGKAKPARAVPGRAQIVSREYGLQGAQLAFSPPKN